MPNRENEIIALVTYIQHRLSFREPPFSFMDFCQAFPNYDLQPGRMPQGFNGEIIMKGPHRIIRYRAGSKTDTNRFSIGHEIGHGFLHEDEEFQCKVSSSFSIFKEPQGNSREWEADYFSAELLMPMPMLERIATDITKLDEGELKQEISRLAKIFGVNRASMKTRVADLAKLREWECEFL